MLSCLESNSTSLFSKKVWDINFRFVAIFFHVHNLDEMLLL